MALSTVSRTHPPRPAGRHTARPARRVRRHLPTSPWLFAAPGLLVTAVFVLYPFVSTVIDAFTDRRTLVPGHFVGLANFRELLHDDMFWTGLRNSVLYVAGTVPALVVLPLLLALLVQKNIPGITFFRSAFYTPVVASIVVVGLIWVWLLDDRGLVNSLLQTVGVGRIGFLSDQWLLLLSAMAVTVWKGLGYYMIIYLAALANVPRELHEAAAVDGAGPVRRFLTVTVPAVRSTMVLVAALSSVAAFKVFSEVYLLAGPDGGPAGEDTTLVMLVQRTGTGLTGRVGYASAVSLVVFAVTVVLMLLVLRADRREDV
ncbi:MULTISPECIES: carbohydrate ABC transporter permease [Streptomyces]|uniref:Sugar ABC transporter permease n=1 Tax=Streptomyces thermoviolaceus subsp. thermoviolaceus TaxID=66860 RepID=A0ABX0YMX6_STRTL|nr:MULTISPECIES: sugar ABC transporter permease [Streptomyces]WTD46390.1 sugar ABC transporter permease [Streptomyces thermoviolaceus]NJP13443.1 sugar ABC transporter permease [Streptomyces thermoviolaceus subsp. thermoviolaceus]RSR96026.1 sugar ABC transporter permease [Streptomyces sp. WAC00469]GGV66638.1 ABC transporter permease [Streptomyces thermoviolaceus subsp. apingens]GHA76828.1 ABC transporter permease [Streptomyces thermoviolaceus subsp. thermoviolaceus]